MRGFLTALLLPARSALAGVTLVGYTAVALLPPYLFKLAVDDGIEARDLRTLSLVVGAGTTYRIDEGLFQVLPYRSGE